MYVNYLPNVLTHNHNLFTLLSEITELTAPAAASLVPCKHSIINNTSITESTLTTLKYYCIDHGTQRIFFNSKYHKCLS